MNRSPLWRRQPFALLLIAENFILVVALLYWRSSAPSALTSSLPPGHPDVSMASDDAHASALPPDGSIDLSGTVRTDPSLKSRWPKEAVVFIIARPEAGGPPYAVRRYDGVRPPFAWSLGAKNVMIGGMSVPDRLALSIRVDQDGDALTRQPGDLEGGPSAPVRVRGGRTDIVVQRETKIPSEMPTSGS